MNIVKFIISLILVINVYTAYEDCSFYESEYTIKNYFMDADGVRYVKDDGYTPDYKDTKFPTNLTFIATKADDCKNRKTRPYIDSRGVYYDSQKDDEREETFHTHCCYVTYDDMDKYEYNVLESKYDKDTGDIKVTNKEGIKGRCIALTDLQYNNIKEYITYQQIRNGEYKNYKIDCNSYYLQIFILNLILLFLF